MTTWTREVDLARALVDDLRGRGWEVYQEVECDGGVADIVAVQGRLVWVIETKLTLGLAVLGQAHRWLRLANLVSCAVPPGRASTSRSFAILAAESAGIGILEVCNPATWRPSGSVAEIRRPVFRRRIGRRLRNSLHEKQKTYAPAGSVSGRYTSFAATCDRLREALKDGPMKVRHAVARLAGHHHYASEASARGSLLRWADQGMIDGVTVIRSGKGAPAMLALVRDAPPKHVDAAEQLLLKS